MRKLLSTFTFPFYMLLVLYRFDKAQRMWQQIKIIMLWYVQTHTHAHIPRILFTKGDMLKKYPNGNEMSHGNVLSQKFW